MGGPAPGTASQTPPGVNGQGPSPSYPTTLNGVPMGTTVAGGAMPGMPATAANPTLHNPNLQHLQQQQQRMSGFQQPGPGVPMQPMYPQRPSGAPMGPAGAMQMGPMGQQMQPQRMPNGVVYAPGPNYRPPGSQQSPQQNQDMQTAGASGSPKQPATTQNSSPRFQERNPNPYEVNFNSARNRHLFDCSFHSRLLVRRLINREHHEHSRIVVRSGLLQQRCVLRLARLLLLHFLQDDQYSKDDSPPSSKRPRRSPQENGSTLPNTPSLPAAQPPGQGRPPVGAGNFNGMALSNSGAGMPPIPFAPPGAPNAPGVLPSAMAGQVYPFIHTTENRSSRFS